MLSVIPAKAGIQNVAQSDSRRYIGVVTVSIMRIGHRRNDAMKHTAALSSFVESINEDLNTSEKQLTATQGKLARIQHRQNQLRAQLEHVSDSDSLQDNSCPACYANSRNDQQLQQ